MHFYPQRFCCMPGTANNYIFLCNMLLHCLCQNISAAHNTSAKSTITSACDSPYFLSSCSVVNSGISLFPQKSPKIFILSAIYFNILYLANDNQTNTNFRLLQFPDKLEVVYLISNSKAISALSNGNFSLSTGISTKPFFRYKCNACTHFLFDTIITLSTPFSFAYVIQALRQAFPAPVPVYIPLAANFIISQSPSSLGPIIQQAITLSLSSNAKKIFPPRSIVGSIFSSSRISSFSITNISDIHFLFISTNSFLYFSS